MYSQAINSFKFLIAESLIVYPAEHVIYGDYVYKTWDEELMKFVLGFFKPENMRVDVVSKSSINSKGTFRFLPGGKMKLKEGA